MTTITAAARVGIRPGKTKETYLPQADREYIYQLAKKYGQEISKMTVDISFHSHKPALYIHIIHCSDELMSKIFRNARLGKYDLIILVKG